ncbi:Cytochrome oxidase assembly protein 1 [Kalmanozyma brasiliensis GHG001]|uniref:Cytochrome oxidase assembly protein 1 n=1 Tax=Kalmanozyma brasiliensis (strain GHG001) TaxID=1365824 RepID=UPI002867B5E9|nr:Cytochrome oxidase assembly protein 1 [Kalmanozyma brasiliensis GHG001]KAF6766799.1 Cytochrome oxidase assembly protein 1 [Kalmanozyma brasiliensis GHG001]
MVIASTITSGLRRSVGGSTLRAFGAVGSTSDLVPRSILPRSALARVQALHTTPARLNTPSHPARTTSAATPPPSSHSNVSARPTSVRNKDLPPVPNTLPYLLTFVTLALASWAGFTVYATNKEKLGSSIFKSVVSQVKSSPEVASLLSSSSNESVVLKRETWLGGQPRVAGAVNMMQGRVDLSFRIHPANDEDQTATVYFTSIRAHKHAPFEILRFVVVNDRTGESVSLLDKTGLTSIDVESGDIV